MTVAALACVGVDIGKNTFHVAPLDARGVPGKRSKHTRGTIVAALVNARRVGTRGQVLY